MKFSPLTFVETQKQNAKVKQKQVTHTDENFPSLHFLTDNRCGSLGTRYFQTSVIGILFLAF
jgi:hypothetical protein